MRHMKLPKSYIKKYGISKTAWSKFKASLKKPKRKANKPKARNRSRVRHMVRHKSSRRRSFLSMSTIFKFIKIGSIAAPAIYFYQASGGGLKGASAALSAFAGWHQGTNQFEWGLLAKAWMPFIATSLITVGIQKMNGIIRRL